MQNAFPGIYPIRDAFVSCHLLVDGDQCALVDTGLTPLIRFGLKRQMRSLGLRPQALKAVFLTHGHLDHTGNADWIQRWSGAPVYVHREDRRHLAGTFPYRGISRVCGWLEAAGRMLFRFRPPARVQFFADDEMLPVLSGWRVVHLPGHTDGHCGFFCEKTRLLLCGDLFASYLSITHQPPGILNTSPLKLAASFRRVAELNPEFMICNHYDQLDPADLRREFQRLIQRDKKGAGADSR